MAGKTFVLTERTRAEFREIIERCEVSRGMTAHTVEVLLMIESALGVYRCFDMLRASPRVASSATPA